MRSLPFPAREWDIPPMDHEAGHKETAFTWAMGDLILQRMGYRETIRQITADPRMPAYCTVFQWVKIVPEFGDDYRAVRAAVAAVAQEERDRRRALMRRTRAWVSGRKGCYTPELAQAVCDKIRWGAAMSEVVAMPGMPSAKVLYSWLARRLDFRAMFTEACDWRDGWLKFQVELAADECLEFGLAHAKAKVAALEGRIGRLTPKIYRLEPRPRLP